MEDTPLHETEVYHSLAQLSQHSSLLSEGSAIAEIEKELQAVMGEEVEERKPTPARRSVLQLIGGGGHIQHSSSFVPHVAAVPQH